MGHARLLLSLYEENLFSGGAFALDICCSFPNISINQKTVSFSLPFTLFNSYNLSVSSIRMFPNMKSAVNTKVLQCVMGLCSCTQKQISSKVSFKTGSKH